MLTRKLIILTGTMIVATLPVLSQTAEATQAGPRTGHHRPHHQHRHNAVDQRQHNQTDRIRQGVRSGELTKDEARGLVKEQKEIRRDIREARSDGVVTREERREIRQEQNQASRHIYKEKHDGEKR